MIVNKTTYNMVEELYLKCFRESTPRWVTFHNASKYILQLLAQFEILTETKNGVVIGCIIYQTFHNLLFDETYCFIHEWFIDPEYRKKTTGARLYKRLCDKAKELGCKRLIGTSTNKDLIKTINKRKGSNKITEVAYVYEKEL